MQQTEQQVQDYFERCAGRFDSFYREEEKRSTFQQLAHVVFRKPGLLRRFRHTIDALGDVQGKKILDVGCGSGLYSIYFAKAGADVTGIDFSANMISLAENNARAEGCTARFLHQDLLSFTPDTTYDNVLLIGVFDYVREEDRPQYLAKAAALAGQKVVATFPKRFTPQMPIRYYWLKRQNCPVYFYTSKQVEALGQGQGLSVRFHNSGPIWTVEFGKAPAA
jgi:cyclopropane fatty-acyl-phospholipid synthase-like methyltransferase